MYHVVGGPIPELTFGTPHQVFSEGTTLPVLFQMELDGKAGGSWVVKAAKRRPSAMLVELACSELCAHFGILTPEVGVAFFGSEMPAYDDSEVGRAARRTHEEHRGELAFCSKHLEGATRLTTDNLKWSRPGIAEQALRLFLFDAFVWHGDRSTRTPNALWFHRQIVAIDHGRAMYNLESTDDAGLGPDFAATLSQDRWEEHIAFRRLCRAWQKADDASALEAALQAFGERVGALDDVTVQKMSARWPLQLDKGGMRGRLKGSSARVACTIVLSKFRSEMPLPTVEFRYLQVVTNAIAGDRATVGLIHWDGNSLRFVFATGAVRSLATYDDIDHAVAALERALRRQVRGIKPGPTIFPRPLDELIPGAETRTGDALVWSPVHVGFARDTQGHFIELQERLGLRARLPKGRHAFSRVLRAALEELGEDLQPRWGDELVKPAHKVRSHYEYTAPISWRNGTWNHAVPVSLAVDLASDLHANVRDAIARVVTSVPSTDTPVLVAVLPQNQAKAVAAEQEAQYMYDALRARGARLAKVRVRVDTGSLDVEPVRQMIETDVAHAVRA